MDSAHAQVRSSSSPSSVSGHVTTDRLRQHTSPAFEERTSSRQQRLIDSRNARFVGKKLSLNDLGTKFTQLIHANEESRQGQPALRDQENTPTKQKNIPSLGKRKGSTRSLGILEEISNATIPRDLRKRGSIPVYLDSPERPLLDFSPTSSPGLYLQGSSEGASPIGFDSFQDSLNKMHLRETSTNEQRGLPMVISPLTSSIKAVRKRRSTPFKATFDTQEYINHIEQELQQARKEMYSPTSNKSLKDQLKTSRIENDRLRMEIASVREGFETEVKNTVEHMMAVEAELKMKVKDLEESLEMKNRVIQDFEYKHEDERLDCNTIETLKAVIESLEQQKIAMEEENRSMSKRNEVLSELLAMSPTKSHAQFELRSPVRERRAGRPMSMILPRLPSSPTSKTRSHPPSTAVSPSLSMTDYFGLPVPYDTLSPASSANLASSYARQQHPSGVFRASSRQSWNDDEGDAESIVSTTLSRTSSSPAPWSLALPPSPTGETLPRQLPKRKPRKFMSGSTQLKPLLLPALTGDASAPSSASVITSPKSMASRDFSQESIDPTTYFLSQSSEMQVEDPEPRDTFSEPDSMLTERQDEVLVQYQTLDEILAGHKATTHSDPVECSGLVVDVLSSPSYATRIGNQAEADLEACSSSQKPCRDYRDALSASRLIRFGSSCLQEAQVNQSIEQPDLSNILPCQLDMEALTRLELPEPEFSPFPQQSSGIDDCLLMDIPQPLFSPAPRVLPSNGILEVGQRTDANGSPRRLNPKKRRQSVSSIEESTKIPIPKSLRPSMILKGLESQRSPATVQSRGGRTPLSNAEISAAISCNSRSLTRSRSPLELLQQRQFGARPLASLTIRTIYGTISRCTSYVRELKRDPLALAKRVIANLWFSNWARFGKLSWWVLGLFISPTKVHSSIGWQWDQYDGEGIAQAVCDDTAVPVADSYELPTDRPSSCAPKSQDVHHSTDSTTTKPGWGKSMLLWGKFSVAIMLAVGGAVVNGPGEMLEDRDQRNHLPRLRDQSKASRADKQHKPTRNSTRSHKNDDITIQRHKKQSNPRSAPQMSESGGNDFLDRNSHLPSFTFRSRRQLDTLNQSSGFDHGDDHDTLRPGKAQKIHAADIFPPCEPERNEPDLEGTDNSITDENLYSDTRSMNSDVLQWPPSPDIIHPEESTSVRNRHNYAGYNSANS